MNRLFISTVLFLAVFNPTKPDHPSKTSDQSTQSPPVITVVNKEATVQQDAHKDKTTVWYTVLEDPEEQLVFVGMITFFAIWYQAKESAKATKAMRDSIPLQKTAAEAALLNAQALIHAERPWLMIQIKEMQGANAAPSLFRLSAFNYGKSPAHIVAYKGPVTKYIEPDEALPLPPTYGQWEWDRTFLGPRDSAPLRDWIDPQAIKNREINKATEEGNYVSRTFRTFVVYGLIEYTDGIVKEPYKTAFCFKLKRESLSDMGGKLIPYGPREYNEYT